MFSRNISQSPPVDMIGVSDVWGVKPTQQYYSCQYWEGNDEEDDVLQLSITFITECLHDWQPHLWPHIIGLIWFHRQLRVVLLQCRGSVAACYNHWLNIHHVELSALSYHPPHHPPPDSLIFVSVNLWLIVLETETRCISLQCYAIHHNSQPYN